MCPTVRTLTVLGSCTVLPTREVYTVRTVVLKGLFRAVLLVRYTFRKVPITQKTEVQASISTTDSVSLDELVLICWTSCGKVQTEPLSERDTSLRHGKSRMRSTRDNQPLPVRMPEMTTHRRNWECGKQMWRYLIRFGGWCDRRMPNGKFTDMIRESRKPAYNVVATNSKSL